MFKIDKKRTMYFTLDGIEYDFDIARIKRIYTAKSRKKSFKSGRVVVDDIIRDLTIVSDKGEEWTRRISTTLAADIVKAVNKYKKPITEYVALEWNYCYG